MSMITPTREGRRLHRQLPAFRQPVDQLPPPDDPCHRRDQKVRLWPADFARIRQFMTAKGKPSEAAAIRALIEEGLKANGI